MSTESQADPAQAPEAEAVPALEVVSPAMPPTAVPAPEVGPPSMAPSASVESLAELVSLRASKGFDVLRVSARLRLAPRQVVALEAGDWAALPGRTFIRLSLRSYGRLLEADVTRLLDAIDTQLPGSEVFSPATDLKQPLPRQGALGFGGSGSGSRWVWLFLLVVGIVVLSFFYGGGAVLLNRASPVPGTTPEGHGRTAGSSERPASGRPAAETESAAPVVVATHPAVVRPAAPTPAAPTSAAPMPPAPAPTASRPAASTSATAGSTQTVPVGAAIAPSGVNSASAAGGGSAPNPLVMRFPASSWIEVRDGSGVVLVTGTQEPGSVRELAGEPPLSLIIGNASGVSVSWRGVPIDVGSHMRQGVARFRIE